MTGSCKMILPIIVLTLLVIQASPLYEDDFSALLNSEQLYYSVLAGRYTAAVTTTKDLFKNGRGDVISLVVNKLIVEGKSNIVEYAYKLVQLGGSDILYVYFPIQLRWMLMDGEVSLFNLRDGMGLKLQWNTDSDGDRGAFGDTDEWETNRFSWKLIPHWFEGERVYFEILNKRFDQYLKLELNTDGDGDRRAFGDSHHLSSRHLWYFHPDIVGSETVFYIINKQYSQALKLGRYVDGDGDRRLWGHNGNVFGNPQHFSWRVKSFNG